MEPTHTLSGIAQILIERNRQESDLGYTAEHDAALPQQALVGLAQDRLSGLDTAMDWIALVEQLAQAGALIAAQIDKLVTANKK